MRQRDIGEVGGGAVVVAQGGGKSVLQSGGLGRPGVFLEAHGTLPLMRRPQHFLDGVVLLGGNELHGKADIELAHDAGDNSAHGKGFAVVAGEVRQLAEQSAKSSSEAGTLVSQIQRSVAEISEQMRKGQAVVQGVEELSGDAVSALAEIVESTAGAGTYAQRIAEAAAAQDASFRKLRQQIEDLALVSYRSREETNSLARQATEAAEGQSDLEKAIKELEGVATYLQALARHFAAGA